MTHAHNLGKRDGPFLEERQGGRDSCLRLLTRLAQHVGKASVGAEGGIQLHPSGHGVKAPAFVKLVQEGLSKKQPGYSTIE